MTNTLTIVLGFVFDLLCLLFWLRFLLQASGADFYNPLSQAVVNASDKVCKPLRRVLPGIGVFDLASLLVAWLVASIGVVVMIQLIAPGQFPVLAILYRGLIEALLVLTQFYFFAILIMVLASFIAPGNYNPALALIQQVLEPLIGPVRRVLPPLGPIDLSPMVVMLLIVLVQGMLTGATGIR